MKENYWLLQRKNYKTPISAKAEIEIMASYLWVPERWVIYPCTANNEREKSVVRKSIESSQWYAYM